MIQDVPQEELNVSAEAQNVLDQIAELVGDRAFHKFARGWYAKAREDLPSLIKALDLFHHRLERTDRDPVNNAGGWIHARYHALRGEDVKGRRTTSDDFGKGERR